MKTKTITSSNLLELHFKRPLYKEMYKVTNSEDVDTFLRKTINLNRIDHKEFFWVILMTQSNKVLGISEISAGKTNATTINYKELVQLTALANASAVVLVHNHPSGKLKPSECDMLITNQAQKILNLIDVTFLDHLIISSEGYYSMVDHDLLTNPNY